METDRTDLLEPIARSPSTPSPLSSTDLLQLSPTSLTSELIDASLLALSDSDALETCLGLVTAKHIEDVRLVRSIVELGLGRGEAMVRKIEEDVRDELDDAAGDPWSTTSEEAISQALERALGSNQHGRKSLRAYSCLTELQKRVEIFSIFSPAKPLGTSAPRQAGGRSHDVEDGMDVVLDDPWEDDNVEELTEIDDPWGSASVKSTRSTKSIEQLVKDEANRHRSDLAEEPPITLSAFLSQPLPDSSHYIAQSGAISFLKVVYEQHHPQLWPYRYALLESIPAWISPAEIESAGLLPRAGDDGSESSPPSHTVTFLDVLPAPFHLPSSTYLTSANTRRTSEQLNRWYTSRVESLDVLGLVDLQLAWVQHGASLGVTGLDALGEDLSLLSRLVYDAHLTPTQQVQWPLSSWRAATPEDVINAYLSNSTPDVVVSDIRGLVLPYLYVLESRAERAGEAHADLVERFLHDALLGLPLHLALPIFEASKATRSQPERIIKNDLTVARLALACLYGSNLRDGWSTMSAIFECLPVWDVSGGDPESDKEATATTLDSIATFVRPTRADAHPPTAKDLFVFFNPLPFASLSRALDILDVHLESGEILARWDTPVQLRFLLQSARDKGDQMELAEKMVRRQVRGPHTEHKWTALWSDMSKLNGGGDALLRGAFGVLGMDEMVKVYLGGVVASGKFDMARKAIKRLEKDVRGGIPSGMLESVVLATSREFYENAESGNIHTGDMKLAYDCLSVSPPSQTIAREREFIEATSRLATFSLPSPSGGGTISPLEVRHAKNKLDLVRQVLETSDDAYRHPDLVLDIAEKLGYRGDTDARIEVLGMLAGSAIRMGDYDSARDHCQGSVELATESSLSFTTKSTKRANLDKDKKKGKMQNVVWERCLELGSQSEYADVEKKMRLLGQAVELCPAESVPRILSVWRVVEESQMKLCQATKRRRVAGIQSAVSSEGGPSPTGSGYQGRGGGGGGGGDVGSKEEERVLGSRTAARAARLAMGFANNRFNLHLSPLVGNEIGSPHLASSPLVPPSTTSEGEMYTRDAKDTRGGERGSGEWTRNSGESDRPSFGAMFDGAGGAGAGTVEAERVRRQARKALVRGVGWLLGADEGEIEGE